MDKYFKCDDDKIDLWRDILNLSKSKKNIGIAISGNPNQILDYRRKINLEYFLSLKEHFRIYIIQKSIRQND